MRFGLSFASILTMIVTIAVMSNLPRIFMESGVTLLFGFIRYPIRLAGSQVIDWPNTRLCLACFIGITLGVHYFGRWFATQRSATWPWSRTLTVVGILLLVFVAGITGVGVTHEFYWLATSEEGLTHRPYIARP